MFEYKNITWTGSDFCLSNERNVVHKATFYGRDISLNHIPKSAYGSHNPAPIKRIFERFWDRINGFGKDFGTNRYKLYILIHEISFPETLRMIHEIKDILWINGKYLFEKDFKKISIVAIDISNEWYDLKIYEEIDLENNLWDLPDFIDPSAVRRLGYMKTFSGRKKKWFQFSRYPDIADFSHEFDLSAFNKFQSRMSGLYNIKGDVKHYCIEWSRKELYFI